MPIPCSAQRADDPAAAAKINDEPQKKTLAVVEREARAGDADAELELAFGYLMGGVLPKNEKVAGKWCLRAARQGTWRRKRRWVISIQPVKAFINPKARRWFGDGALRSKAVRIQNSISENSIS
jgi:hypothetical protein